ncbi:MAG: MBL fold metallo-hydrolase [Chloroflexi bacterium]|nr:MBL fold metallo-hydrolase [Chloroflexota bacterium]
MTSKAQIGTIELGDGVHALIQEGGATNAGFIVGDSGVLVIEALMSADLAKKTIREVKRVTRKPIRWVVLTHYHWDHSFAAEQFLPSAIVGHAECREELVEKWEPSVESASQFVPDLSEEFRKTKMVPPDVVFTDRLTLHVGERRVELHYFGRAHTKGDIFIYVPGEGVLFGGDVISNQGVPYVVDGFVSSWISVLERARSLDVTKVVPGHGLITDKQSIGDTQAFLTEVKQRVRKKFDAGKSQEEAARGLTFPKYASWRGINDLSALVKRLYMEFRGEL